MKAILLSIKPEHAKNILNGKKTLELRKSVPKDFVGWVYVYVTKGKHYLTEVCQDEYWNTTYELFNIPHFGDIDLNGKVAFRFWFDEYETIKPSYYPSMQPVYETMSETLYLLKLSKSQVNEYGKGKDLYAWHIKKLEVFDKPMDLGDFIFVRTNPVKYKNSKFFYEPTLYHDVIDGKPQGVYKLKKAPQSYQHVWVNEELK